MNIAGAQHEPAAGARRAAVREERHPRGRAPRPVAARGQQRAGAAARALRRSAAGARRARHGADRARAGAGGAAARGARAARAGPRAARAPFDPAHAGRALHDHHQRLRRLRGAAQAAGAPRARGARRATASARLARALRARPTRARRGGSDARASTASCRAGHRATPLFEDRFVCVVRAGHARVRGKLSLATYVKLPHVLVSHQPDGARRRRRRARARGPVAHGRAAGVALPAGARRSSRRPTTSRR